MLLKRREVVAEHIVEAHVLASRTSIVRWVQNFQDHETVEIQQGAEKPLRTAEDVQRISRISNWHPKWSVRTAKANLNIRRSSIHQIPWNRCELFSYRVWLFQQLGERDYQPQASPASLCIANIHSEASFLVSQLDHFFLINVSFTWNEKLTNIMFELGAPKIIMTLEKYQQNVKSYSLVGHYISWSHWNISF